MHLLDDAFPGGFLNILLVEVHVVGLRCVVECLVQAPTVVLAVANLEKTKSFSFSFTTVFLHTSLHDMWWLGVVAMELDEVYFPSFYSHGFSFFLEYAWPGNCVDCDGAC